MRQPLTQTNAVRNRAPRRPILRWSRMGGVGLLWALSAPAFAFFQETPALAPPVAQPLIHKTPVPSAALHRATEVLVSRNAPGVVVEGHGIVRAQSSQAHRIPLQDAMTLLLPPGWRYEPIGGAADVNPPVSWQGVAPWTARLGQIGRTEDLRFVVNWPHKTVTARIATPKPVVVVMPMQPAPRPGRIPQPPKPAPVPHWTMPAGIPSHHPASLGAPRALDGALAGPFLGTGTDAHDLRGLPPCGPSIIQGYRASGRAWVHARRCLCRPCVGDSCPSPPEAP